MRGIKFQAWDLDAEQMYNWESIKQLFHEHLDHPRVKVREYTGLKDCNGVEIYEGDIIHCVHWFFNGDEIEEHFTASVGFRDGSFTLENIKSRYYSDFTGEENGKGICWIGDINYCEEDYEVIGNIYENPELLTEK